MKVATIRARVLARVRIVRFVDADQPGWVECELLDALGHKHRFIDKVPIFSLEDLDAASPYPRDGVLECELLAEWEAGGRRLARIDTSVPLGIESTEGATVLVVSADQLEREREREGEGN
jgi:hypothetical protein